MSDFLLTSRRMKVKKVDAIKESKSLDNWVSNIIEYTTEGFEGFLTNIDATEQIKTIAKGIEWELILSLFNIRFYELIEQFELPKNSEIHWNNLSGFRHVLFESIKTEIYYYLYFWIKMYYSNKSIEKFNDQIFDLFLTKMNSFIRPFDFQYSMTSIREKNDPKVLIRDLQEIERLKEKGESFDKGKQNRKYEIKVFELIIEQYNEKCNTPFSKSYKQIARELAFEYFNYEDKEIILYGKKVNLFENFYNRFLDYKNTPK